MIRGIVRLKGRTSSLSWRDSPFSVAGAEKMYKILIVEDDRTIAENLAAHLRRWNYEVEYAEDFKN